MAGKKGPAESWRHTTVVLRADIFDAAQKRGIDISDATNRALAEILAINYRQQRLDAVTAPQPVIIARDGGIPAHRSPAAGKVSRQPVINADDPMAAGSIAKSRKQMVKKPAPVPAVPEQDSKPVPKASENVSATAPAPSMHKKPAKKAGKDDVVKKFIAAKIIRGDDEDAVIQKEEFYALFSRWCREQKVPVPDMKEVTIALKTRFAFREKTIGGSPCWTHVRFR